MRYTGLTKSENSAYSATMSRMAPTTMTPPIIHLYDVRASTAPQPWAPNIWRVRFILNFKRLRYKTIWLDFAQVEPTLHSIGAPPSSVRNGRPVFTLPVVVDPTRNPMSPEVISNPNQIAEYLEAAYPARPVFPEGTRALQTLFVHFIQEVFAKPLLPVMLPLSHHHLSTESQAHFRGHSSTSSRHVNAMPTQQREVLWRAVQEQFDFLAMILDKNSGDGDGVVVMGSDVTYADFALCSILIWIERMDTHDGWSRVRSWNGGRWYLLLERCREYMDVY